MNSKKLMDKYFSNKLSESELLEFNNLYDTDSEFKQEVDFLNHVKSISEKEDDLEFKKQLASFEAEYNEEHKNLSPRRLRPLIAVAAVLIIALSIQFVFNNSINGDKLFMDYFEASKNVSAPIVRAEGDESILNKAFVAYNETNYQQAVPLFNEAFKKTQNSELLFYEGNALLALGKTEEAIEIFKEHLTHSDPLTKRSHWYLALAYLKSENLENSKQELNNLINSGESFKKPEANSLLKKLN